MEMAAHNSLYAEQQRPADPVDNYKWVGCEAVQPAAGWQILSRRTDAGGRGWSICVGVGVNRHMQMDGPSAAAHQEHIMHDAARACAPMGVPAVRGGATLRAVSAA